MPPTTIKTVILAPPNLYNEGGVTGITLSSSDLTGYSGALFWMQGQGGKGFANGSNFFAGTSGYINSGYVDFEYPYEVDSLYLQVKTSPESDYQTDPSSRLQITYKTGSGAPINSITGKESVVFHGANAGFMYDSNTAPYAPANTYIGGADFGGGYIGAGPATIKTQLGSVSIGSTGIVQSSGSVVPLLFGNTTSKYIGGGGYYGGGGGLNPPGTGVGATGFASGGGITGNAGYYPDGSNRYCSGFVTVSLIPSSMTNNPFFISGNTGSTGANSSIYLYQLLGAGGAGGSVPPSLPINYSGYGGGGSGSYKSGFFNTKINSIISMYGGTGGVNTFPANDGTSSRISYTYLKNIFNLDAIGGSAGSSGANSTDAGAGGTGFFCGGMGTFGAPEPTHPSNCLTLIPCNSQSSIVDYAISMNGGGFMGRGYPGPISSYFSGGQDLNSYGGGFGGGGGGGWYGGYGGGCSSNISWNAGDGIGYGCGGGGSNGQPSYITTSNLSGNGSDGYVLLREFNPGSMATLLRVTSSTTIAPQLFGKSGVWTFLSADNGLDALNTLHFSIPNDGLKSIIVTNNDGTFNVKFYFSNLQGYTQIVSRTTQTIQKYINFLIYQ